MTYGFTSYIKSLVNFLRCCFCFMLQLFGLEAHVISAPRPSEGSLNRWTAGEVPKIILCFQKRNVKSDSFKRFIQKKIED